MILLTVSSVLSLLALLFLFFILSLVNKRENSIVDMLVSLGKTVSDLEKWKGEQLRLNEDLADSIEELNKEFDGIPKEDLQSKYDAEKAWNDGVQAIMSFGLDLTNKDGAANG